MSTSPRWSKNSPGLLPISHWPLTASTASHSKILLQPSHNSWYRQDWTRSIVSPRPVLTGVRQDPPLLAGNQIGRASCRERAENEGGAEATNEKRGGRR